MMKNEDRKNYLANKHKGGISNEKGAKYEDFYAVYQIVSCLAKYKNELDTVSFQSQLKDTYVDDLLIAHPSINIYHQLKNTQKIAWGNVDQKGDIAYDFERQKQDCKERNESFALKLVHSALDSRIADNIPNDIKDVAVTEWFPYQDDINKLVLISDDFREALIAISCEGEKSTDDVLVAIATSILGAWRSFGEKSVTIANIVERVETQKHVNLSIYPDAKISDECAKILDAIDGFSYHINGRMFYWNFGLFQGACPWPEDMEERILNINPKTKQELLAML